MSGVLRRPVAADRAARLGPLHIDTGGPWQDRAACNGLDPDAWFAEGAYKGGYEDARETCVTLCPVRDLCLEMAVKDPLLTYGMYGGLTPDERRQYRARRRRAPGVAPAVQAAREAVATRRFGLWSDGLTDRQIAERERITVKAVFSWRKFHGLKPNKPSGGAP